MLSASTGFIVMIHHFLSHKLKTNALSRIRSNQVVPSFRRISIYMPFLDRRSYLIEGNNGAIK